MGSFVSEASCWYFREYRIKIWLRRTCADLRLRHSTSGAVQCGVERRGEHFSFRLLLLIDDVRFREEIESEDDPKCLMLAETGCGAQCYIWSQHEH